MKHYLRQQNHCMIMTVMLVRYNSALLQRIIDRDGITLIDSTQVTEKLTRDSTIMFLCSCGQSNSKVFRNMFKSGAVCSQCLAKQKRENQEKTWKEKYGTAHPFQNKEIKQKAQQTMIDRYGVAHPSSNPEFHKKQQDIVNSKYGEPCILQTVRVKEKAQSISAKEKRRATCQERYGYENPFQSEDVKQKIMIACLKSFGVDNP